MPTIDLRRKADNTPPQKPSSVTVTDADKVELRKAGWKDGEAVSADLLAIARETAESRKIPQIGDPKDYKTFDQLTAEEKALLTGGPGKTAKSFDDAVYEEGGEIDTDFDPSKVPGLSRGAAILHQLKDVTFKGDPRQTKVEPKPEPIKDTSPPPSSGVLPPLSNCPHCGWSLAKEDVPEPTEEDKLGFVQSVLGGGRFKKRYDLLSGKLIVVFRTLVTEEADMAFTQTARDLQKHGFTAESQYFRTLMDYRLSMSIELVTTTPGITIEVPEVLSEGFKTDPPPPDTTKLCYIVPYIYTNVLKTEALRRMVGAAFFRFQRLVELLELRADHPDFYKAIGEPRC